MALEYTSNGDTEVNNIRNIEITPFVWEIWAVSDYIPFDEETFLPQLTVGDEVWIKKDTAGYSHVTLYIGRGKVVHVVEVDKTGLFPGKTRVSKDALSKVATNRLVGLRKTLATKEEQMAIVLRALKDVGKVFPYVLTSENCEHQVKYWITGRQDYNMTISTQVKDFLVIAGIFGLIGLAVGGGICGALLHNGFLIAAGTLGTGIGFAILGIGLKYCLTAFEHRTLWY